MKPEYPERIRVWQNEPNKELVASFPGDPYVAENSEYIRIDLHEAALLDAHQRGKCEGLEEAARAAQDEFERAKTYHPEVALGAKFARDAIRAKAQEMEA